MAPPTIKPGSMTARLTGKPAALAAAYGMDFSKLENRVLSQFVRDPWRVAIARVMGSSAGYAEASPAEQQAIQERYRKLAHQRTPDGRRAAKVVAIAVAAQLAPEGQQTLVGMDFVYDETILYFKTLPKHDDVMDATRNLQAAMYAKFLGAMK